MNASQHKKTLTFLKNLNFRISKKKEMPFKLFEFLDIFMIGAFLITLTQLEKSGSIGKIFILLEILKLNSTFETRNRSRFFAPFPRSYLESAIYVTFNR